MNLRLLILFVFCDLSITYAQDIKKSVAILTFSSADPYSAAQDKKLAEYQATISSTFVSDKRFSVVEREKLYLVSRERELQKTEDFMDGKVVQQGVSIGADYVVTGNAQFAAYLLTLSVYDVATGKVIGKEEIDLKLDYKLKSLIRQQFIHKYFPLPGIKLVKVLEGSSKAGTVLIAAGSKVGLARKEKLEVKELIFEEVGGELMEREVTIGIIKVSQIENDNFSICSVEEGGKLIAEKIAGGVKLYCKRGNL